MWTGQRSIFKPPKLGTFRFSLRKCLNDVPKVSTFRRGFIDGTIRDSK